MTPCSEVTRTEGETMISNNFTKRRQNGFKIGTRDKNMTHFEVRKLYCKLDSYLDTITYDR